MTTNDVAELARVTCEEYYTEPAYGMDPECDPDEDECFACGGYGYLGVEDELCTVCIGPRVHVREALIFEADETIPF